MTLIQNWQSAWKFTSVQSTLLLAALSGLFYFVPLVQDYVSPALYAAIMGIGQVVVALLRIIAQPSLNGENDA
jgi:hypothetical protein